MQGEDHNDTEIQDIGEEIVEMNIKIEKMGEIITSNHDMLRK